MKKHSDQPRDTNRPRPFQRLTLLAGLLTLALLLAACAPAGSSEPTTSQTNPTSGGALSEPTPDTTEAAVSDPTDEPRLRIVSSFVPMYIFTANLIEGVPGIELTNMAAPDTGCLHDYQLVPADMMLLESADLFVINGAGMEGFIGEIASSLPDLALIEASHGIELLPALGEHDHEHDDDDEHDEAADDHEDHGDELDGNPHVWLSIPLAIEQVQTISAGLQQADPEHAEQIQANETAYVATLQALYTSMNDQLAQLEQRQMMTFHEAFPYFAQAFDLEIAGVILRDPGSEPSAAELAETIDKVRDLGLKALFAEPQYPERVAETIAAETGAQVFFLDPITTGTPSATLYEETMRKNLQVLLGALG